MDGGIAPASTPIQSQTQPLSEEPSRLTVNLSKSSGRLQPRVSRFSNAREAAMTQRYDTNNQLQTFLRCHDWLVESQSKYTDAVERLIETGGLVQDLDNLRKLRSGASDDLSALRDQLCKLEPSWREFQRLDDIAHRRGDNLVSCLNAFNSHLADVDVPDTLEERLSEQRSEASKSSRGDHPLIEAYFVREQDLNEAIERLDGIRCNWGEVTTRCELRADQDEAKLPEDESFLIEYEDQERSLQVAIDQAERARQEAWGSCQECDLNPDDYRRMNSDVFEGGFQHVQSAEAHHTEFMFHHAPGERPTSRRTSVRAVQAPAPSGPWEALPTERLNVEAVSPDTDNMDPAFVEELMEGLAGMQEGEQWTMPQKTSDVAKWAQWTTAIASKCPACHHEDSASFNMLYREYSTQTRDPWSPLKCRSSCLHCGFELPTGIGLGYKHHTVEPRLRFRRNTDSGSLPITHSMPSRRPLRSPSPDPC